VAALVVLALGAVVHAALNVVGFRSTYHHIRYFAPAAYLIPALAVPLLLCAVAAAAELRRPGLPMSMPASQLVVVLALAPSVWALDLDVHKFRDWRALHLRNADQLGAIHLAVGKWLREQGPPGVKRIAAFDIGALRWASRKEIVDMAGTSSGRALAYRQPPREVEHVRDTHAEIYVSLENGWDHLPASNPNFSLELLRTWQYQEYADPYPPHGRRMVVYRVNHCGEPRQVRQQVGASISFDGTQNKAQFGTAEGTSFTRWPVGDHDLWHPIHQARGRFISTDSGPLRDAATGRFETVPMKAEGDFLSFRMAGGMDPVRLRVELRSEGKVLKSWTGWDSESFLEIVHPIAALRGKLFSIAVVDASKAGWGHLAFDEVQQFVWREAPALPCPKR
jgi:hypothetical protein